MKKQKKENGFTLIELSIVLVVIGLIVGGVLVGQDLIRAAQIRSTISKVEEYKTAANTFRLKYNCLPGDCKNATDFFGVRAANCRSTMTTPSTATDQATCNGDGNRRIWEYIPPSSSWNWSHETTRFWQHLSAAGLFNEPAAGIGYTAEGENIVYSVAKAGYNSPTLPIGKGATLDIQDVSRYAFYDTSANFYPESLANGNSFILGSISGCTDVSCKLENAYPVLTVGEAAALDEKVDDGSPSAGWLTGAATDNTRALGNTCTTQPSISPSTAAYNVSGGGNCTMYLKAGF